MKGRLMFAPRGWLKRPIYKEMYHTIEASRVFDKAWYRTHNLGFPHRMVDPVWHYITKGSAQGYDPGPLFDTSYYRDAYPDVKNTGINPLYHFVKYGKREQRSSLRSGRAASAYYLPHTASLRTILVDGVEKLRCTLVIDANTPHDVIENLPALLRNVLNQGEALRIIIREPAESKTISTQIHAHQQRSGFIATITHISGDDSYTDCVRFANERFVATSWSSSLSLMPLLGVTPVHTVVHHTKKTPELRELTATLSDLGMVEALVRPDLPALGVKTQPNRPVALAPNGKIGIYCDPENAPLGFIRTIQLVEALLLEHPANQPPPTLYVFGGVMEPFAFWGSLVPSFPTLSEASTLASDSTAVIALSEHPLPPDTQRVLTQTHGLVFCHQQVDSEGFQPVDVRKPPLLEAPIWAEQA
jgi:hypothetical protein